MSGYIMMAGLGLMLITWLYTIVKGFQESFSWGITALFSGSFAYAYHCWWEDKKPGIMIFVSLILFLAGTAIDGG